MKPAYGLELIQTQKLVLTPELHQAIMILQMNVQELSALIAEEVENNPLLDLVPRHNGKIAGTFLRR
jgi:RNA polymerase sigma-54 factor